MRTPDLARVIASLPGEEAPDGALLERYIRARDELAFAGIVRRHGGMVWAVCNRVLRDVQDCEDAFQATFLLLVRKAGSVGRPELLGNWLHGVALRTALQARKARRNRVEKEARVIPRFPPPPEGAMELREVVDREIARLPARYRAVVILCLLEGRTRGEAARQLEVAEGTVGSRLGRGRAILAKRLARHGLPAGMVAALLAENSPAAVPKALVVSTVTTAGLLARGGAVPAPLVLLMETVLHAMLLTKLKVAVGVLLVTTLLSAALGSKILTAAPPGEEPRQPRAEVPRGLDDPPAKESPRADPKVKNADLHAMLADRNDARFDEQFNGRWLRVTVRVESVTRASDTQGGTYYFVRGWAPKNGVDRTKTVPTLGGWGSFRFTVNARKQLAALEPGKPVTIEGRCTGKVTGKLRLTNHPEERVEIEQISFDDCRIVAPDK